MLRKSLGRTAFAPRLRELRLAVRTRGAHTGEFESRLVWMFGSPRSGSSWLLRMLGEHDAVIMVDEPLIGWYLGPFLSDLPGGDASALSSSDFTLRRVQLANRSQFFAEQFADVWVPSFARMVRSRFYAHAARYPAGGPSGGQLVVIKEPNGSQSADVIMRALPRSRLLFLLRDGRDVVDSELAGNLQGSWVSREFPGLAGIPDSERLAFVVQSAHKWLWRTEVVQSAFREHRGAKYLLRYEELLESPREQLRGLFHWLGLAVSDVALDDWTGRNRFERLAAQTRGPDSFFRAASPGQWRQNLRPEEQTALARILGPKLRELGYGG